MAITWTAKVDGVDYPMAAHINKLQDDKLDIDLLNMSPNASVFPYGNYSNIFIGGLTQIYFLGDSLTANGAWATRLMGQLDSRYCQQNRAVYGRTAATTDTQFSADVSQYGNGGYVIVWAGINDVIALSDAATIKASLASIYAKAKAIEATVIAITITPFKTHINWSAEKQAVVDEVNAWMLGPAENTDYVYDAYSALEDPGAPDTLLAAYDYGDHLHLSVAGYNLVGDDVFALVAWDSDASTDAGLFEIPRTTSLWRGVLRQDGNVIMHAYKDAACSQPNFFVGPSAGNVTMTGTSGYNIALGPQALASLTTGYMNTAIGLSLVTNSTGIHNVGVGHGSLWANAGSSYSVAIGGNTLYKQTGAGGTVSRMIAIGYAAGYGATTTNAPVTDYDGILIGYQANRSVVSATQCTNYIGIGTGVLIDKSNQTKIGNASVTEAIIYGDHLPGADDTNYLGKNDDDSPAAWKGVILKDTTNGKYYRVEVINGVVTPTDLTD